MRADARSVRKSNNTEARPRAGLLLFIFCSTKEKKDFVKMMVTLLEQMPHGLQMRVSVNTGELVWCGLQPEFLTGSPIDIVFKHGAVIPGQWNVLGILDALPDALAGDANDAGDSSSVEATEIVAKLMENYLPIMRMMMGRPGKAYGITPLLVFREIGRER